MARELELKLEVDPADVERLRSDQLLHGQPRIERQISVYYDTPKGKLRRQGWVLRVREHDKGWIQTVKRASDAAGLFDRDEWESPVNSLEPDLLALGATPLKDLVKPRQFRHLMPVFRTDIERTAWQLNVDQTAIELTYDSGKIEAGAASEPVSELELELKDGDVGELFGAARRIALRIPSKLGVRSKPERGFSLAEGEPCLPVKATPVALDRDTNVADGFTAIVTACLKHFRLNEPLLIRERNVEALHQLRVAVRRLRSAMWLFKPAVNDPQFGVMSDELRQFTRELGAARNIDVILSSMPAGDPAHDALEHERGHLYARILRKLGSRDFRDFLLDLLEWTHRGAWRRGEKAGKPLTPFALKRLDRLWSRIELRGDILGKLEVAERHRLRIDTKKMRYSLEFLRELLLEAGKEQEQFIKYAERLQDRLGLLNDLATRQQIVGGASWLLMATDRDAARHLRAAKRSYREMRKIGAYWRRAGR